MVIDLVPGGADAGITDIEPASNGVFFGTNGAVFKSDGTAGGTVQLAGPSGSVFTNTVSFWAPSGANLAFSDRNNVLWRTDGTTGGTFILEAVTGQLESMLALDPMVYYIAHSSGSSGLTNNLRRHPINMGGSSQLVYQAIDSPLDSYNEDFGQVQVQNGNLYFEIDWTYDDGFDPPTSGINCYSANNSSSATYLPMDEENFAGIIAGWVYFWSFSTDKIFRTDGTSNNTTLAINLYTLGFTNIDNVVQAGSKFFFTPSGVTDLTPAGSRPLPVPGSQSLLGSVGSNGLFSANDGVTGTEPWVSDGTTNGTHLLKDIAAGVASPPPAQGVLVGTNLYFTLRRPGLGTQLWKSDGTTNGTAFIRDFVQPNYGPSNMVAWNNLLFFSANDGTHGMELWRSDGTSNGTFMVRDCRVGLADSFPSQLTPASSLLFFVADDGAHGAELWESDGTSNGTFMGHCSWPGPGADRKHAGGRRYRLFHCCVRQFRPGAVAKHRPARRHAIPRRPQSGPRQFQSD
jgi:ELWxxDGT repeat protein